jgi:hypothetical protein
VFSIYTHEPDGRMRPVLGPADLAGYAGPLVVTGTPTGEQASRWASSLGLAVARGCSVRRLA